MIETVTNFDLKILDFIAEYMHNPFLDKLMPIVTRLGSAGIIWIVIGIILLFFKRYRRAGISVLAALLLSLLLCNIIIKPLAARIRPFDINTAVQLIIKAPPDYSFPSGHTSAAFAASIAVLMGRHKRIGVSMLALAFIIAFSRLYLYVHYPTDVLCGMIIGTVCGVIGYSLTKLIGKKKKSAAY